jgi:hypothetical protein
MKAATLDAIVFFDAADDLAGRQIFPAPRGLIRDAGVNVLIVAVAKAGWAFEQPKPSAAG